MNEIVFLLEEPSAEAMLQGLLPRLLPSHIHFRCIVFEGKSDLERNMVRRMRGYRVPAAGFVVMRDKDAGDCYAIKKRLYEKCAESGHRNALVRIVCHELESWYLADLAAVERAMRISGISRYQSKKHFASPDKFPSPSKRLRQIVPDYQKVNGSRAIGPFLDLENARSHSFSIFVEGIRRLCMV